MCPEEPDFESSEDELDDLELRLEELESRLEEEGPSGALGVLTPTYSLGATLATILSWDANHALLWAIIHGLFSWLYVVYYAIRNWEELKLL